MKPRYCLLSLLLTTGLLAASCSGGGGQDDAGVGDADADAGIDGGDQEPADDGGLDAGDEGGDEGGDEQATACELDYECPAGQVCRAGFCEAFEAECEGDDDCAGEQVCRDQLCVDADQSPLAGLLVFNEVLIDGNTDGDPNGDGSRDGVEDEFIELVNVSNRTLDLDDFTLVETDWDVYLPRHTFAAGTQLEPLDAIVVFGGGDPPESTDSVLYLVANAQDPGTAYGLDLDDDGDHLLLLDADGWTVAGFVYGDEGGNQAISDESATRDPDLTGDFTQHSQAQGAQGTIFSPGSRVDGNAF